MKKDIVEEFEAAVDAYSWKGAGPSEDVAAIEAEYNRAKVSLYIALGQNYDRIAKQTGVSREIVKKIAYALIHGQQK